MLRRLVPLALCSAFLASCGGNATSAPPVTQTNPLNPNFSKLQLAVGTANFYGTSSGLNVVSTLRQANGLSATGVNTPKLTGPFSFGSVAAAPAGSNSGDTYATLYGGGVSLAESLASPAYVGGTPQSVTPGTPYCDGTGAVPGNFTKCLSGIAPNASTFGQSGGVFAMGLAPYNAVAATGQAYSYAPYAQPLFETDAARSFVPWGGPPAFDPDGNGMGTRDGLIALGNDSFGNPYFLGIAEGITAFEGFTPATGSYTLSVQIAIVTNGGGSNVGTIAARANLASTALLPTLTTPAVTPDGTGALNFTVTLPAGLTDGYVQIADFGPAAGPLEQSQGGSLTAPNCQGAKGTSFAPVYYTVHVTQSGAYSLAANHGPNTNLSGGADHLKASPSICTAAQNTTAAGSATQGDNFSVQLIGFDYPGYAAASSLMQPTPPQTPAIAGANGQADISLSAPVEEQAQADGSYVASPLSGGRSAKVLRTRRR